MASTEGWGAWEEGKGENAERSERQVSADAAGAPTHYFHIGHWCLTPAVTPPSPPCTWVPQAPRGPAQSHPAGTLTGPGPCLSSGPFHSLRPLLRGTHLPRVLLASLASTLLPGNVDLRRQLWWDGYYSDPELPPRSETWISTIMTTADDWDSPQFHLKFLQNINSHKNTQTHTHTYTQTHTLTLAHSDTHSNTYIYSYMLSHTLTDTLTHSWSLI